jgi:hypothetical protein
LTQLGSGTGTQLGESPKSHREPATPPPKFSPRAKIPPKQAGAANENTVARVCDSPGERAVPAQAKGPAKVLGRSPKKP